MQGGKLHKTPTLMWGEKGYAKAVDNRNGKRGHFIKSSQRSQMSIKQQTTTNSDKWKEKKRVFNRKKMKKWQWNWIGVRELPWQKLQTDNN